MASFLAQAYANFLKDKLDRKPELARKVNNSLVGFDTRHFSPEIGEIITRVLAGNGFQVFRSKNNAPSPTPVNSVLTFILGCVGSLNITASHNPADQNGVKPNNEKGHLDADDDLETFLYFVEEMYADGKGSGQIKIAPLGENVKELDFDTGHTQTPIVPVMLGEVGLAKDFSARLFDEGVFAMALGFPTVPRGQARIRVMNTAAHSKKDLDCGLEAFEKVGKALGVI